MDSDSEDFSSGGNSEYIPSEIDSESSYELTESEDEESGLLLSNAAQQLVPQQITEQLQQHDLVWSDEILPIGREQFTGDSGVHRIGEITNEDGKVDILKIFEKLLSGDIMMDMIENTNAYAHYLSASRSSTFSRIKRWKDVDVDEMKTFFGILMLMGIVQLPTIEHYWKLDPLYNHPLMHRIQMSYNRFTLILRCWHFTSPNPSCQERTNKTYKIDPFIRKLLANFRSLYTPSEILVVDESVVKFNGRLQIKTYNPSKSNKYGIRIYKMCTVDSYTWSYEIYSGASSAMEGLDKPASVLVRLCEPLLGEGRMIIADNYYNSVPLAIYLKNRNTDLCGTMRKNRVDLPLRVTKAKLKKSERIARQKDGCITVLKWRDNREVLMLSTCHGDESTAIRVWSGEKIKPNAVIDYNDAKKGIDMADQLASFHSPIRKSMTWYKKIAVDLLFRVAVINARCIYNKLSDEAPLSMLQVQEMLLREMLGSSALATNLSRIPPAAALVRPYTHFFTKIPRQNGKTIRKRCFSCYSNLKRDGRAALISKQVSTECKQCSKAFCLACFNLHHKDT